MSFYRFYWKKDIFDYIGEVNFLYFIYIFFIDYICHAKKQKVLKNKHFTLNLCFDVLIVS